MAHKDRKTTRRSNGEGSIVARRDKDGRVTSYQGQLRYTDDDSRARRFYASGRTKAEVRDQLREAQRRLEDGAPVRDARTTLAAWMEEWISTGLEASNRRRATKDLYQGLLRNHVAPTLGTRTLDALRPAHIEALLLEKKAEGKAASTLRNLYAALRACLDGAVRDGLVKANAAAKADRPRAESKDAAYRAADQAQAFVRALAETDPEVHRLVRFMLLTGLRRGEALGLRWSDVDSDDKALRVRSILSRTSEGLALGDPKTAGSRRTIPLGAAALAVLREQHRAQTEAKLACPAGAWTDSGLVFTTPIGTPWDPRNALRRFQDAARAAGLPPGVHLHTLRHSAATFLLAAGVTMKEVQVILGHSSYTITADIYAHVAPAQARTAMEKLGEAMGW